MPDDTPTAAPAVDAPKSTPAVEETKDAAPAGIGLPVIAGAAAAAAVSALLGAGYVAYRLRARRQGAAAPEDANSDTDSLETGKVTVLHPAVIRYPCHMLCPSHLAEKPLACPCPRERGEGGADSSR